MKTFRKKSNGTIVNTDKKALLNAKKMKEKREREKNRIDNLEKSVKDLNTKMDSILDAVNSLNSFNSTHTKLK